MRPGTWKRSSRRPRPQGRGSPDKGEILYALHEEGFERVYRKQRTILSIEDPLERLGEHARIYISFALEMPEFYDLMFIMKAPAREIRKREEWSAGKRSYDFLRQNVQACIDARYFKGIDVETLTFFKWAMVHGIASLVIRPFIGKALVRVSEKSFMMAGGLLFGLGSVGYLCSFSFWILFLMRIVQGFGSAFIYTAAVTYVARTSPETASWAFRKRRACPLPARRC